MKKRIFLSLLLLCFPLKVLALPQSGQEQMIRTAVLKDQSDFYIALKGPYEIKDAATGAVMQDGRQHKDELVAVQNGRVKIGGEVFRSKHLTVASQKDIALRKGDKEVQYRGAIDIIVKKNGKLLVVNVLGLEEYVRGVLYHEVSHRWPLEAIKAQAVATRSYALYQAQANKDQPYDVTSDIYSQVYGGKSAERYRTNIAAERTKGEVLVYNGDILPAYFHANSGGHTEDVRELWKHDDLPPLRGIVDPYAQYAPSYYWKRNLRLQDIQEKLNANGHKIGMIKDIAVSERNESGRVRELKIALREGGELTVSGKKFRDIIGPNIIRSNNYEITMKGYYFDLIGHGWGHGVGMSQWGAQVMARKRINYKDILQFYYPGAEIIGLGNSQE